MGIFQIDVDDFSWICGPEDDPEDLCLHGHVTVQVGERRLEDVGTVSATALYLLKTLTEDKVMEPNDIQMVPCCGFFLIANEDLSQVTISGCDNGLDWSTRHEGEGVRITLASGESTWVDLPAYTHQVLRFAEKVEGYYRACQPKKLPEDDFDRRGYLAFWNEWRRRYAQATRQTGAVTSMTFDRNKPSNQHWKEIMAEKLKTASAFEIHCWKEEKEEISMALQFGTCKESTWQYGKVIEGRVTPAFCAFLLGLPKPADTEVYNKMTPFFTIALDNGFWSEHYGTELNGI